MAHGELTDDRNQFDAFVIRDQILGGKKSAFAGRDEVVTMAML
jgi:hypothetical protein